LQVALVIGAAKGAGQDVIDVGCLLVALVDHAQIVVREDASTQSHPC
jgi:hypothetical protein